MSKIFEEALADAKKLREVAEENAKKVILESVTPKIREFIEEQLLEKDDESESLSFDKEDEREIEQIDETTIKNLLSMIGEEDLFESLSSSEEKNIINKSINKAINRLNLNEKKKISQISNKINQNIDKLEKMKINNNIETILENNSMKNEKYYEIDLKMLREAVEDEAESLEVSEQYLDEETSDESLGLDDELMKEIKVLLDLGDLPGIDEDELKLDASVYLDPEEEEEEELEGEEEELEGEEELPDLEGLEDLAGEEEQEEEPQEEDEEEPINETFEIDPRMLRQELAKIKRQLQEGKVDHQFGGKAGGKAGVDGAFGGKGKKNAGVKSAFGGGKEGQDPFTNPPQINKLNEAIRKLRRMNRSQTEKLNKYRGAVKTLREQLEDLNLFNAKLLYVNKLLQNKGITESQKKSVIKALDEAKNINETKALYKSLTESLTSTGKLNESTRFGSSSRVTTSASSKKVVGELGRWQKLAGLK
jgi:hypothetical protein